MRIAVRDLLAAGALAWLASCGTYTTYQTAEPLAAGRWQLSAATTAATFADRPQGSRTPGALGELAIRRGVGADTDVGVKLFSVGSELSVRHRLVNAAWQWAALAAVAYARTKETAGSTEAALGQLRLTAVATRRTSARWAFSTGPVVTGSLMVFGGGGDAHGVLLGAFANARWSFGPARAWSLVPELSLHATVSGDVPVDGSVALLGLAVARDL